MFSTSHSDVFVNIISSVLADRYVVKHVYEHEWIIGKRHFLRLTILLRSKFSFDFFFLEDFHAENKIMESDYFEVRNSNRCLLQRDILIFHVYFIWYVYKICVQNRKRGDFNKESSCKNVLFHNSLFVDSIQSIVYNKKRFAFLFQINLDVALGKLSKCAIDTNAHKLSTHTHTNKIFRNQNN